MFSFHLRTHFLTNFHGPAPFQFDHKLCRMCGFVFLCGPLLSAGTASSSSRNPLYGVFRHVLLRQESTVIRTKNHDRKGNTRRLQRESEDDETPQRAFYASEEAHREPAESVVYFRSGSLCRNLYQL